jgi:hypothetical protein
VEDYSRYDQIGECSGWLEVDGVRVEVDSWWACRDHSWGVREMVGIPEPRTGPPSMMSGGFAFAFLFFSTATHAGHVQFQHRPDGGRHLTAQIVDRSAGSTVGGERVDVDAEFVDSAHPRRVSRAVFDVTTQDGQRFGFEMEAQGPAVAMQGLGYGGYDDGLGLGVWRGGSHIESDAWDVSHPAEVVLDDGTVVRPFHRIQPVRLVQRGPGGETSGTGSLTFIAEMPIDADGHLRLRGA